MENPQIVVACRSVIQNDLGEFLFVRRSLNDSSRPGLWEFPGGKLEAGQDFSQAFCRETEEETGLAVELVAPNVFVESYHIERGRFEGGSYIGLFGLARVIGGSFRLSVEHCDSTWAAYEKALLLDLVSETRKALDFFHQEAGARTGS